MKSRDFSRVSRVFCLGFRVVPVYNEVGFQNTSYEDLRTMSVQPQVGLSFLFDTAYRYQSNFQRYV